MNNKTIMFFGKRILQASLVFFAAAGFVSIARAQTWTPPPSSPPSSNVAAPINVGGNSQFKIGAIGVGESTSTTVSTSTGFDLEVNGPVSANGFASFGESDFTQFTHLGPVFTGTPYSGAMKFNASNSAVTAMSDDSKYNDFADNDNPTTIDGIFGKIEQSFAQIFSPNTALAVGGIGSSTLSTPPTPGDDYGPCFGNFCSSSQYCDVDAQACESGASASGYTYSSATVPEGKHSLMTVSLTASSPTISVGGSSTLNWTVSSANSCYLTSSNLSNNYSLDLSSQAGERGTFTGSHTITFSSPGVYTYILRCSAGGGVPITSSVSWGSGGISVDSYGTTSGTVYGGGYPGNQPSQYIPFEEDTATITVGDAYDLQVNGNSSVEGYINADGDIYTRGNFIEQGRHVCLQDGTDCPLPPAHIRTDSTGNIDFYLPSLGYSTSTRSNLSDVTMYLDGNGLHIAGNLYVNGTLYQGTTALTVP